MSYPGSKGQAGVYQRIIGQMPVHSVYCEPFFGSGTIFFKKRPAAANVIIDADAGLMQRAVKACSNAGFEVTGSFRAGPPSTRPTMVAVNALVGDAISILPLLQLPPEAVVYCDPPYPLNTRQGRLYYDYEMTDVQHSQLLKVLRSLRCRVMVSSYPNALYDETLLDWRRIDYRTRTRGRTLTETLWMNFPEPEQLHDWTFAGENFRQRLSLKRLAARWLARLEAMPPRKRGYILNAIADRAKSGVSGS